MRGVARAFAVLSYLSLLTWPIYGQHRVSSRQMYERLLAVVPIVGQGTLEDPKRPMFAPSPKAINPAAKTGIIAYTYVLSDDGKYALCEFVARDRATLNGLLNGPGASSAFVSSFIKGQHTQDEIVANFKKYKKDFNIDKFGAHVQ